MFVKTDPQTSYWWMRMKMMNLMKLKNLNLKKNKEMKEYGNTGQCFGWELKTLNH